MTTEKMYSISDVASILDVTEKRIREYEKEGVFLARRNPSNNYRVFTDDDVRRLKLIRNLLHEHGLNLPGIRALFALVPCWMILQCDREKCGIRNTACTRPCYDLVASGTDGSNLPVDCNPEDCKHCPVFLAGKNNKIDFNILSGLRPMDKYSN